MPIRWTPDKDQLLLLLILKVHGNKFTADAKKIAEEWPGENDNDKPTARAITERLVKIRQSALQSGVGHFAIASSQTNGTKSMPSTPRKRNTAVKPKTPGSKKRKIKREDSDEDEDDENIGVTVHNRKAPVTMTVTPKSNRVQDEDPAFITHTSSGRSLKELVSPHIDDLSFYSGNLGEVEASPSAGKGKNVDVLGERQGITDNGASTLGGNISPAEGFGRLSVDATSPTPAKRPHRLASERLRSVMADIKESALAVDEDGDDGDSAAESDVSRYEPALEIKFDDGF